MTVAERVRGFILETFYVADPADLGDDTSLIDSGLVDSTGMLEVILFLEAEYGIAISDRETTPENLETITRIVAFIGRKQAAAPAVAGAAIEGGAP